MEFVERPLSSEALGILREQPHCTAANRRARYESSGRANVTGPSGRAATASKILHPRLACLSHRTIFLGRTEIALPLRPWRLCCFPFSNRFPKCLNRFNCIPMTVLNSISTIMRLHPKICKVAYIIDGTTLRIESSSAKARVGCGVLNHTLRWARRPGTSSSLHALWMCCSTASRHIPRSRAI